MDEGIPTRNSSTPSVLKRLSGLFARLEIQGSKSKIYVPSCHHQEVFFDTATLEDMRFAVVVVLLFEDSHLQLFGQRPSVTLLISPQLGTRTTTMGRREYKIKDQLIPM